MKRCPLCQTTFPDDANFCPMDAGRLDVIEAAGAPAPAATPQNLVAGRFQLGEALGGHRTGQVFAAVDQTTGQACVVKLVAPPVHPTPLLVARTEREVKQLQKLESPRIARVLDTGKHGPLTYIASEKVAGVTLDRLVATSGALSSDRAQRLAAEIGEALAEAAKAGVIHRDVAPKNVLVGDGDHVKLINFAVPVPISDKVFGVAEFLSPEGAEGKSVDQRSNIYSLGGITYFLLTGKPPFTGDVQSVLLSQLNALPTPPSQLAAVSPALERVVLKTLEKQSSKRHMTLKQALTEIESGGARTAPVTGAPADQSTPAASPAAGKTMFGYAAFGAATPGVVPAATGGTANPLAATMMNAAAPFTTPAAVPAPVAVAAPVAAAPVAAAAMAPTLVAPPAPVVPAAAVMPSPALPVADATQAAGGKGKAKAAEAAPPRKGAFRETMWFKKGELDAAAAQAAASAPVAPDSLPVSDKADEMAMEDRYKDDGSITSHDRQRLSLRTGATQMMQAVPASAATATNDRMDEKELAEELKAGRGKVIAILVVAFLALAGIVTYFATAS